MQRSAEPLRTAGSRVVAYGTLIRFSHTVFALPFALSGVLFAAHAQGAFPGPRVWLWVVVAMVGARSAAMAFNRVVDARIDAANPRTAQREIPRGVITRPGAAVFTLISIAVFLLAAYMLNPMALKLSPIALFLVLFYSLTKRFTWATHLFLGAALAVAPLGGWVAVTGRVDGEPFLLAFAVCAWVAGFDIFYALQDQNFDREHALGSVPARFGTAGALRIARVLHASAFVMLLLLFPLLDLSGWYLVGVVIIGGVLLYEHRLVRADDLSKVNRAFFDMNAVISMLYLAASGAGVWL